MAETDNTTDAVSEIIGIYHADGTIIGELSYWLRARFGDRHCALCEITHGSVREKAEWRACRSQLGVPVTTVHLNERSDEVRAFSDGRTPCVIARTGAGYELLVDTDGLVDCDGSPERLVAAITAACEEQGLRLG